MTASGLPHDVAGFIRAHIHSVELLEVLLLLNQHRERVWDGESVAAELRIQPRSAATRLENVVKMGAATREAPGGVRFDAGCPLCPVIEQVAQCYQTHRVSIIQLIFSRPHNGAEAFANAFLIGGKGKPDG